MKPQGLVYKSGYLPNGEIRLSLSSFEKKVYKLLRLTGASLVSLSITSVVFFYGQALATNFTDFKQTESPQSFAISDTQELKETSVPITVEDFSISIPKINAESKVIYNVDPFNEESYKTSLKEGVAHAKDTGLPGEGKRIYLFAHSTNSPLNFAQFNAVFYQLRELSEGDEISLYLNEKEYKYIVEKTVIVNATDTSWLIQKTSEEDLVLQTCDPPGTTFRRLLVIAKPNTK